MFDRVLRELGRPVLNPIEAAYRVAAAALADVVAGRMTPYEGAARVAYGPYQAAGMPDDLTPFYYWADEWEDHPEYRERCEADIRLAAEDWLAAHGPPAA